MRQFDVATRSTGLRKDQMSLLHSLVPSSPACILPFCPSAAVKNSQYLATGKRDIHMLHLNHTVLLINWRYFSLTLRMKRNTVYPAKRNPSIFNLWCFTYPPHSKHSNEECITHSLLLCTHEHLRKLHSSWLSSESPTVKTPLSESAICQLLLKDDTLKKTFAEKQLNIFQPLFWAAS